MPSTIERGDFFPVTRRPRWTPRLAWLAGYMPLRSTGVDSFRLANPEADGRGVLIAILDTGVDPSVPGLLKTTTGERKLLDVRDFSGEGSVDLTPVLPDAAGRVRVGGRWIEGFGRVAGRARRPFFAGMLEEQGLGVGPAADLNGNGSATDRFPVAVARSTAGWFVVIDANLDGSFEGDPALYDYAVAGEVLRLTGPEGAPGPFGLAVNLGDAPEGDPQLTIVMDNSGHGTHVAGIAAGHNLFDVEGFEGVAPGAQLLSLKISDNARGGISVTGSMLRALNYAADVAQRRRMRLVVNLSYGVGHQTEGTAAIDSIVDEFALKYPDVPVIVSLGNDGPGLSSTWLPASAEHAIAVCALLPGVFAAAPEPGVPAEPDRVRWWSSRGGEVTKPDICAPGIAYSTVPAWRAGEEISDGTSMAAPHVAGVAALLLSAAVSGGRQPRAIDVKRAMTATATPIPGTTVLDAGRGVVNVPAAYRWLMAGHQTGVYTVRALGADGSDRGVPGAYWRGGLTLADTLQRFRVQSVAGQPAARLRLVSDAPWLMAPEAIEPERATGVIEVAYDRSQLGDPGVYVGTVWAVPESDTLAGPSYGLTSTIVVPHALAREGGLELEGRLGAGAIMRYPIHVPVDAAGLRVRLVVGDSAGATVHLFEPDGRPYREVRSAVAGQGVSRAARLELLGSDVVGGTYEVVVAAPPAAPVAYRLEATVPRVRIESVADPVTVRLAAHGHDTVQSSVEVDWIGARWSRAVEGAGAERQVVRLEPPVWATAMVLEVSVDPAAWALVTDFGVTVFTDGTVLSAGPLAYAEKRGLVALDSIQGPLEVELAPAFAHLTPPDKWAATLAITYLPLEPAAFTFDSIGTRTWPVAVGGNGTSVRPWGIPDLPEIPPGFGSVVEARVTDDRGVTARWRGVIGSNE